MFSRSLCALVIACLSGVSAWSQIVISGVTDRSTYTDSVTFTVQTNVGFTYAITLNGAPVTPGAPRLVNTADYYDLAVRRTDNTTSAVVNSLVRFIVQASDRGAPEKGLIKWTPYPSIDATSAELAGAHLELIAPRNYPLGLDIPVIGRLVDSSGNERRANATVSAAGFESSPFRIRRGLGFGYLPPATNGGTLSYAAQVPGLQTNKQITIESSTTWTSVFGILPGNTTWAPNSRILVTADLTIPAGLTLTIGAGTIVRLNPGVNITNTGATIINGTTDQPVVFTSNTRVAPEQHTGAWGGFLLRGATASLVANGAIMTGAGASSSFSFSPGASHKTDQALLLVHSGARAALTNCFLINQAGQIANGYNSDVTYDHCLLQRAITSGEYEGGTVTLNHSAVVEFPEDSDRVDAAIADGDYDGIYFTTGTHVLLNSLFGFAKDDAIDSGSGNAGTVVVSNCWMEAALHEGLAWSGSGRRTWTYDSVVMNCGQGIESGWTIGSPTATTDITPASPDCFADRLLSTANSVGARFGDNYDWGYRGFLRITNALVLYNYRNVFAKSWNAVGIAWDTNSWVDRLMQMDLEGNYFSTVETNFPANTLWDPLQHGQLLAPFMRTPADAPVGIGLALWHKQVTTASLSNGVPVRLSSFTTHPVSVDYLVETASSPIASGTLQFAPGETLKRFFVQPPTLATGQVLRVRLLNPVGGEITTTPEAYAVNLPPVTANRTTLIPTGSVWAYWDKGTDQGTVWRERDFPEINWLSGPAELGNGDSADGRPEATMINIGGSSTRFPTLYFRRKFQVANPSLYESLTINLLRDDGGVVYLNTNEVFRSNMPTGTILYGTYASGAIPGGDETVFFPKSTSVTNLVAGTNICAVEIHNANNTSSDISFDLELLGILKATPPSLYMNRLSNQLVLFWNDSSFQVEQADNVTGPWSRIGAGESPISVNTSAAARFYRLAKP